MKLFFEAIFKFLLGVLIVSILLFVPAGSLRYYNAWLLLSLLFIPMFLGGIFLMIKNPSFLKRRLENKEKEIEQKYVLLYSSLMFILGFVISGLNFRYKWIILDDIVVYIGSFIFIISYILYALVLKENTYLNRTIKVEKNQKLISTGLYGIVRHPMYLSTILLFLSMPLILNSILSFVLFLIYPFIIVKRINNEEMVLEKELSGYIEYEKKVKYKLIPFIW